MKKAGTLFLATTFIFLYHFTLFGQSTEFVKSTDQQLPRVQISEVSVAPGFVVMRIIDNTNNGLSVFRKLSPNSEILAQDLQKFENSFFMVHRQVPSFRPR